ncbi:SAM-dependent methyltransferase [Clostridium tyrobutyricum]|uniref:Ribosomal RNA adenine dimethylase domain protein n=1 Tax=Clostridium tyrobutyricum DIVETGP TaxID=1408889 RepID=W6N3N2_CLOTY|nr:rRNA adenine N-6-methyltransferase family protein [Clostridium tyrobutyricum]AND83997.1 methyltransferase [Clostridium tyrobutyricum]ANP68735.1 SAM-dependent methyltransferase [Clostridium tyrobutyricum]MBV4422280.1 SAM-dependent methyltransferase [Clostridium tyrobutyricum]MBV4424795.1 SAM-dependent methyltransferase [Clostridium tyrobutyricum]MBV4430865.1 SAM-dependent methyltransferase [Clostridium tyrobutyricum]
MIELSFMMQYLKKPRATGAVLPSSRYLANKMIMDIDFKRAKCIVEYGPGTGVFTEKILENRNSETTVILFEYNEKFYNLLKYKFKNEDNLFIVHDSCENIERYLNKYNVEDIDYIISGLPFASLPKSTSINILEETKQLLNQSNGRFITFQYTLLKVKFLKHYFKDIKVKREFRNIPPAYVLSCINK